MPPKNLSKKEEDKVEEQPKRAPQPIRRDEKKGERSTSVKKTLPSSNKGVSQTKPSKNSTEDKEIA